MDLVNNTHTARAYSRWVRLYEAAGGDYSAWSAQEWLEGLAGTGYSRASIGQARAAITKAAKARRMRGGLGRDEYLALVLEVETPRLACKAGRGRRWLSLDELQAWVGAMQGGDSPVAKARNRVVALLLGALGLREAEVCKARWEDLQRQGGRLVLAVRGKGGGYDPVVVPAVLEEALELWGTYCPKEGALIRRVWKGGALDKAGVGTSSIYRMTREAGIQAGVGRVSPHDIRATVAGLLHDAGAEMGQISRLLRHKNEEVTRRYIGQRGAEGGVLMAEVLLRASGEVGTVRLPATTGD